MPWPRLSVILMFLDSWFFLFSSRCFILRCLLDTNVCLQAVYYSLESAWSPRHQCARLRSTSTFFSTRHQSSWCMPFWVRPLSLEILVRFSMFFLAEKVHIVWSPKVGIRRLESPVYLICITCVSFYCIVITFLFSGKYGFLFFDPRSTSST